MQKGHQVVIVGGGFGGLLATQSLKRAPVTITLIDRRNFHLFQPLLYQVATGGLSPANIAAPLRGILKNQENVQVLMDEVTDIDVSGRRVVLSDTSLNYDTLIVAAGSQQHYFGNSQWEALAPGLKTIEEATEIRSRILLAFEAAERESNPEAVRSWLTFVIVGGGPTGVELAGTLGEIANDTFKHDFRKINPSESRILLLEGTDRILPPFPPELSAKAMAALQHLGVTVRTHCLVTSIDPESVTTRCGAQTETIPARTVIWAAGVKASPLGQILAKSAGAPTDTMGRVVVQSDLTVPGHPEIFVIGDLAHCSHQTGSPLPGLAPVAMQQGRYVSQLIVRRLRGKHLPPFHYHDYGTMATIGRAAAVVDFKRFRLSGYFAWLTWLFVHLMYIVEFENRLLVLTQWAWNYFTRNRAARLITGDDRLPFRKGSVG